MLRYFLTSIYLVSIAYLIGLLIWLSGKESVCNARNSGLIHGQEDPLGEGVAAYSHILAWRIPWIEEPSRL